MGDSVVLGLPQPIDGVDFPGSLRNGWPGRDAGALVKGENERTFGIQSLLGGDQPFAVQKIDAE